MATDGIELEVSTIADSHERPCQGCAQAKVKCTKPEGQQGCDKCRKGGRECVPQNTSANGPRRKKRKTAGASIGPEYDSNIRSSAGVESCSPMDSRLDGGLHPERDAYHPTPETATHSRTRGHEVTVHSPESVLSSQAALPPGLGEVIHAYVGLQERCVTQERNIADKDQALRRLQEQCDTQAKRISERDLAMGEAVLVAEAQARGLQDEVESLRARSRGLQQANDELNRGNQCLQGSVKALERALETSQNALDAFVSGLRNQVHSNSLVLGEMMQDQEQLPKHEGYITRSFEEIRRDVQCKLQITQARDPPGPGVSNEPSTVHTTTTAQSVCHAADQDTTDGEAIGTPVQTSLGVMTS